MGPPRTNRSATTPALPDHLAVFRTRVQSVSLAVSCQDMLIIGNFGLSYTQVLPRVSQINMPACLFCMSWCADFEFRVTQSKAQMGLWCDDFHRFWRRQSCFVVVLLLFGGVEGGGGAVH